ncbi:DUF6538 domain-containing protein [Pseudomonas sp. F3-2]|uniref:DUF6538 domain-containing protein n=1 Tax=Pseudomonas sp. F3-2 TaxID=3141539 RepID=UPI00315C7744
MANNLELQGGTYHVRLAIPADVQKAFGNRRILSQSLMTGVHKEALDRRLPILAKWKNQIKIARDGKPLPDDWQDNIKAAVAELDARKRLKKLEIIGKTSIPSTLTASEIDTWISKNPEALARLEKAIEAAAERGLQGEIDFQDALHFAFKADIEKRFNQKHKLTAEQQKDLIELLNGTYKPRSPITKTRLEAFRTFRIARNVELKTIDQQQSKLRKLSSFLTDTGRTLDYDAVTSWLESIKLSSKTLTQYLLAGSVFWKWALKHDTFWREEYKDRANPFENHDLPRVRGKDRAEARRKDYTIEALANLHAEAMAEGRKALADLILLCIFTGARIEELCTLRSENVIEVDGVRCLDIPDSKTVAEFPFTQRSPIW